VGHDLVVGDELRGGSGNGHAAETFVAQELHEVKAINRGLERLREFDLGPDDLLPLPRVAGREPPVRFVLEHDDSRRALPHVRELAGDVRKLGERGLAVTRFKGLGEMDAEELWETTLDPSKRRLVKVQLEDALKAEEMFRTLMGKEVQERKAFIFNNSLKSVEDIDYGA
jgi:DNA gyrase subunit B